MGQHPGADAVGGDTLRGPRGRRRGPYADLLRRAGRPRRTCGGRLPSRTAYGSATGSPSGRRTPLDWIVPPSARCRRARCCVPLNTRFKGAEAAYVLSRSRARLLLVTGTFLGTSYVASLRRAAGRGSGWGRAPERPPPRTPAPRTGGGPGGRRPRRLPHLEGLPRGRGGCRGGGGRRGNGQRPCRIGAVGHRLHLGHDGPAQGRGDHARTEPAGVRGVVRAGRSAPGGPLSDREPLLPHLRLQGRGAGLSDAGRDDDPAAGLQRGHGAGEHRVRAGHGPAGPADLPAESLLDHPAPGRRTT